MQLRDIRDIMFFTMIDYWLEIIRNNVDKYCTEYENDERCKLQKYYENGELVGFSVYYDTSEYRMLEAGYYIGKDRLLFLREWRKYAKGIKVLRAFVQKPNTKMVEFYKNMGFKIIKEDLNNLTFERKYE